MSLSLDFTSRFSPPELRPYLPYAYNTHIDDTVRLNLLRHELQALTTAPRVFCDERHGKTFLTRLAWDSDFFGANIWKLHVAAWGDDRTRALGHLRGVEQELQCQGAQYVFGFIPATCIAELDVLGRGGWSVVEVRGLFYRDLEKVDDVPRFPVVAATEDDVAPLGQVAAEVVNPFDRFHADDYFDPDTADRFMRTWVANSIRQHFAADTVLRPQQQPAAFLSIDHHRDLYRQGVKDTQLVLAAVHPRLKGWFYRLLCEALHAAKDAAADYVSLMTQLNNRAAVITCGRMHMQLAQTILVVRKVLQ